MARKIGILGGTFNPIHFGHLAAAEEVRDRLKLDQVLFIPSAIPPHKQDEDILPAVQRLEMVRLAVAGNSRFAVSDIEVRRGGKSYTVDTIDALRAAHPGSELFFITGLDSFLEIRTWKEWERLLSLCCFIVLSRPGYRFADLANLSFLTAPPEDLRALDAGTIDELCAAAGRSTVCLERIPFYDISSTDIRDRVRASRTIKYHLPEAVETYIIEHRLYA